MSAQIPIRLSYEQDVMREMVANKVLFPLFVGGYGSGKSFSLVVNVFETLFIRDPFHGCKIGVYAPTYDLITLNLVPKFREFFDDKLSGKIKYKYNKNEKIIYLDDGKQIIFRSTDTPDTLVGYDHYESHSDESDIQRTDKAEYVHEKIQGRNRQVHPVHGPDNTVNVQADYTTPESYRFTYKKWEKGPGPGFKYVRAPTWSNRNLPKSYVRSKLSSYTPEQQRAYLKGIWTNLTSGSVYSYFDPERHYTNRLVQTGDTLHVGIDFNVGGCCTAVYVIDRFMVNDRWSVIIHQVAEFADVTTYDVVDRLKRTYATMRLILYPDSTGKHASSNAKLSDLAILEQGGWEINATSPPFIEDRINAVQRLFYQGMLLINPNSCPETWAARMEHAYNKLTGKPQKYPGPGTVDDRNDAADYPLEKLFPVRKSIPVTRVAQ